MSDPRRLLEQGAGLELELLHSALDDAPSSDARKRTMVALGVGTGIVGIGVTAASSTAASTAASTVATGGGILKWIGIGVVSGGLAVGGAQQAMHFAAPQITMAVKGQEQATVRVAHPVMARVLQKTRVVAPPPAVPTEPEPEAAIETAKIESPAVLAKPALKRSGSTLAAEVAELDRARDALAKGDASGALDALEAHDKQFGTALLGPEAMVLRLEALAQRGDTSGAAALANQFLAAYPESPHANRVRSILARSVVGPQPKL